MADKLYVLRKGGYFYRANYCGYTAEICAAGRYTKEEAESHADPKAGVTAHLASEFPDTVPRMDGSPAERLLFRVEALREALQTIMSVGDAAAARELAAVAISVDDGRARG